MEVSALGGVGDGEGVDSPYNAEKPGIGVGLSNPWNIATVRNRFLPVALLSFGP